MLSGRFPCRLLSSFRTMEQCVRTIAAAIPPLTFSSHKGEAGRIGVIGGCREYTGAPYFAAISALKVGCDLSHVFCTRDAAPVVKSYSPELIVHPILDCETVCEEFSSVLPRLHSVVVGPGLGRDPKVLEAARKLIQLIKQRQLPVVLDADALFFITQFPDAIRGYKKAILTPNAVEFKRLYSAVSGTSEEVPENEEAVCELCKMLDNVTIVKKGHKDVISDGVHTFVCAEPGSPRRCGGQGDLLSGSMAVFTHWAHSRLNADEPNSSITCTAAMAACVLTRKCSLLAFQKYKRSMTTTEMVSEIHAAFTDLFPSD